MHITGSLIALTLFALALLPAVDAGVSSKRGLARGQRTLERTLEAYRLLRWAAAQPVEDLRRLPAQGPLPAPWPARLAVQKGDASVSLALKPDVDGRRGLARLVLSVAHGGEPGLRVTRLVVVR